MPLLWQIIISVGSGLGGVIVGGLLNHSLMIRQEHKLRIFNARIEVFSKFSDNVEMYIVRPRLKEIDNTAFVHDQRSFFLSNENEVALKKIRLVGSMNITDACASHLISFLSSEPEANSTTIDEASNLLELLTQCMKYDLGHTNIDLNRKPRGKNARSLKNQVKKMGERLFNEEKSLSNV